MTTPARAQWAWDIESDDWDQVKCVVATSSAGDVERWWGPDALYRADTFMGRVKGNWIAHAGGIYDTLLLMNAREQPFKELILSGSAILCAKDGALRVRDSFRWWLSSLKAVGEYVDKLDGGHGRLLKLDVDRQRIDQLTQSETLDYCERDCRVLLAGVDAASAWLNAQGARVAWTSGSSALNTLQALEPYHWAALDRFAMEVDHAETARECVRGARVESWASGAVDGVFVYDFKSAYPAAYVDRPLGLGCRAAQPGERENAVWLARWYWPHRHKLPPVLDQGSNAGAGWCEAWCCSDELDDLEAAGVRPELLRGWAAHAMVPIGQAFVRELYAQKEGGAFFAKVFLNSLHGKFSENPIREAWRGDKKPTEWWGPDPELIGSYWHYFTKAEDAHGFAPRHVQPVAAAQILGRTRSRLYRALRAVLGAGHQIYYSDTDSLHCSAPPDVMSEIGRRTGAFRVGKGLGELNSEGGPFHAIYLAPKAYCLCDPSTGAPLKGALKGVPWKGLRDGIVVERAGALPVYRQARGGERGADLRRHLFERVLRDGKVHAQKEGILTFLSGLKKEEHWGKNISLRTIQQQHRNKGFRPGTATVWSYRTPSEIAASQWSYDTIDPVPEDGEIAEIDP